MPTELAEWLVLGVESYVAAGICFGIPFVIAGIGRLDSNARQGTLGFKLIVFPGVVALWPVLFARLLRASPREENNAHRLAARRSGRLPNGGGGTTR